MIARHRLTSLLIIPFIFSLLVPRVVAQQYKSGPFSGTFSVLVTSPRGQFLERNPHTGFGAAADLGGAIPGMPLIGGLALGFAIYDFGTEDAYWYDGSPADFRRSTLSSEMLAHLFLRFQPQYGAFRPYFEGLVGTTMLWSSTSVEDTDQYGELGASHVGAAFSYGAGGGISILVHETMTEGDYIGDLIPDDGNGSSSEEAHDVTAQQFFLDARVRYLYGTPTGYYPHGSAILDENGDMVMDSSGRVSSHTDLLLFSLGLTIRF